jgi:OsmC-like protein
MPKLSVTHVAGDRFELQVRGHRLVCDQPVADGGSDQGPTPTELFVASLTACVAFYAGRFLARHDLDPDGLRVDCDFTMSADRPQGSPRSPCGWSHPTRSPTTAAGRCSRSPTTAPCTTPSASHPTCASRWSNRPAPTPPPKQGWKDSPGCPHHLEGWSCSWTRAP